MASSRRPTPEVSSCPRVTMPTCPLSRSTRVHFCTFAQERRSDLHLCTASLCSRTRLPIAEALDPKLHRLATRHLKRNASRLCAMVCQPMECKLVPLAAFDLLSAYGRVYLPRRVIASPAGIALVPADHRGLPRWDQGSLASRRRGFLRRIDRGNSSSRRRF